MTDEAQERIERLDRSINALRLVVEAQRARDAKLYPERPLAKVLEFKPRGT